MSADPSVTAFAPATVASLGPGLGVLGLALDGPGNTVTARLKPGSGVRVVKVYGTEGETGRPGGASAAEVAAAATLRQAGVEAGIELEVAHDIPDAAGLGGAAASTVAAAYAVNLLIGSPLRKIELMSACLGAADGAAAPGADSIAPALLGGMILIHALDPLDLIRLPVPEGLTVVAVTPKHDRAVKDTRRDASADIMSPSAMVANVAHASALVAACHSGDLALLGRALHGAAASSTRTASIRGCDEVFSAALDAGALGSSIAGNGPSIIALCRSRHSASEVAAAMIAAFRRTGIEATATISAADCPGARRL